MLAAIAQQCPLASAFLPCSGDPRPAVVPAQATRWRRTLLLPAASLLVAGLLGACGDDGMGSPDNMGPPMPPMPVPSTADPDCPDGVTCLNIPAAYAIGNPMTGSYGNYDLANRPLDGQDIRYIIIHTTDATWDITIKTFQNPSNLAAAHYLVRSSDGAIAKFISPTNLAWQCGNWFYNMHSIGIEHEAWAFDGYMWLNETQYVASAKLVRHLARRYGVPLDRAHILGHDEVPGTNQAHQKTQHWDPGPYWDWDHYMKLLNEPDPAPGTEGPEPADEKPDNGAATVNSVVAIRPDFAHNIQPVTYCYSPDETMDCHAAPDNPVHFLPLRQAPDPMAPYIVNPYLTAWPGDRSYNWGTKVGTGTRWVLAARQNDWDGIYFSGQLAWYYNPGGQSTRLTKAAVVTPRAGLTSVPVWGVGYPDLNNYHGSYPPPAMEKIYDIAAGQRYVVTDRFTADYYWAKLYGEAAPRVLTTDNTEFFQIDFNHRTALVKVEDMELVGPQ